MEVLPRAIHFRDHNNNARPEVQVLSRRFCQIFEAWDLSDLCSATPAVGIDERNENASRRVEERDNIKGPFLIPYDAFIVIMAHHGARLFSEAPLKCWEQTRADSLLVSRVPRETQGLTPKMNLQCVGAN